MLALLLLASTALAPRTEVAPPLTTPPVAAAPRTRDCDAEVVKNISNAAADGCGVVCDQDAFGWNCKSACLYFVIVDGIINALHDGFALADDDNGGDQLDAVARCTTELSSDIASISGAVGGTQESLDEVNARLDAIEASLAALHESMNARFDGTDTLICTPQGQRACFPASSAASEPTGGSNRGPQRGLRNK